MAPSQSESTKQLPLLQKLLIRKGILNSQTLGFFSLQLWTCIPERGYGGSKLLIQETWLGVGSACVQSLKGSEDLKPQAHRASPPLGEGPSSATWFRVCICPLQSSPRTPSPALGK